MYLGKYDHVEGKDAIFLKSKNKKGFTLIEVVIVMAIIGILASLLVPAMMGYIRRSREKRMLGNTKSILDAASAAVGFAYSDEDYGSLMTKNYNGHKCGVITSYDLQQAQLGGTPTTVDGVIAKIVVDAVVPNGRAFSFEDYSGGADGPMGQQLSAYEDSNPDTPGFVMIFNESGEIERLEYSMGNQICIFGGGFNVYSEDAAEAVFTSV